MADIEKYISLAEITYKSGNIAQSVIHAKAALRCPSPALTPEMTTSLGIFIARAYSKLGRMDESNRIYRALLNEKTYLPPVIMGLLYNNLKTNKNNADKISKNIGLMKIYIR